MDLTAWTVTVDATGTIDVTGRGFLGGKGFNESGRTQGNSSGGSASPAQCRGACPAPTSMPRAATAIDLSGFGPDPLYLDEPGTTVPDTLATVSNRTITIHEDGTMGWWSIY